MRGGPAVLPSSTTSGDTGCDPQVRREMPAVTVVLETRDLSRRFGGLTALSGVSLQVEEGSIVGIIGPNGAGKTTLINVVTGFLKPTSGRVLVDGQDATGARPWEVVRLGIGRASCRER